MAKYIFVKMTMPGQNIPGPIKNIKSRYEIYIAVSGLTVDQSGVNYYEIGPEKSFVNDLGMD